MLKFFAKMYEKICVISAVLNFLLFGVLGAFGGYYFGEMVIYRNETQYAVIGLLLGLIIALFVNVMLFGFIAQIVEIRKSLEKLEKKE